MNKLPINAKMLAGFLIMIALLVLGGTITILYTYRLHQVTSDELEASINGLQTAQKLQVTLFQMRGSSFSYLLREDARWLRQLEDDRKAFAVLLEKAKQEQVTPTERDIVLTLSKEFQAYEANLRTASKMSAEGDEPGARALLLRASVDEYKSMYEQCVAFVAVQENKMHLMQDEVEHTNYLVRLTTYGLIVGGIVLGGLLGWLISRSIVKPIYELVLKMRDVQGGEFLERFDVVSGGELEALDRHVHELIERINATTADLEKNRRLLARSEKLAALGRVGAGVAHEIRNPLTAIKMLIYSLREDLATSSETRNDLDVIFKEIERIERFVQNFLDFARPPAPHFTPMQIAATLRETLALLAPRLRSHHILVHEHFAEPAPAVWADPDQIKQVLMNLVLNAIDFMPQGGTLWVETKREDAQTPAQQAVLQICIRDSGRGIPPELLDNLFDPFVSGREEGIGLGLSIAHQIVHRHHGWIDAMNHPEGGATFVVSLPIAAA